MTPTMFFNNLQISYFGHFLLKCVCLGLYKVYIEDTIRANIRRINICNVEKKACQYDRLKSLALFNPISKFTRQPEELPTTDH